MDVDTITIPLTQGQVAVIDACDYEEVRNYRWFAVRKGSDGQYWYAATTHLITPTSRRQLQMHRLLMKPPPGMLVDHVDHNGLNNRRSNLRLATYSQNAQNKKSSEWRGKSYKGVIITQGRIKAAIRHNNRQLHLGYFDDELSAALAYDKAARELFGEFALVNFPQERKR